MRQFVSNFTVATTFALLALGMVIGADTASAQTSAVDPGPRGGRIDAGKTVAGLSVDQLRFFADAVKRFTTPDTDKSGLGPAYNGSSCGVCHVQPANGGSSPSTTAFPNLGPNPQIKEASLDGATNKLPFFITPDGPVREARFKYFYETGGQDGEGQNRGNGSAVVDRDAPDGGVHDLFTIAGRADAPGCVFAQEDFDKAQAAGNLSLRIPTPLFGDGLIEGITDATIVASFQATAAARAMMGIKGVPNRNDNDGTISRFGWKAQNRSLLLFSGEAYSVEIGETNLLFSDKRGFPPTLPPASCILNPLPEDAQNMTAPGSATEGVPTNVDQFATVMRFLDQPTPACTGTGCSASIQNGRALFAGIGCALCHTPSMTTGKSAITDSMTNAQVNLFSDLMLHHMGKGLDDGVTQGHAGPDQFRSAPLWGIGQRIFFLHDGRTTDLLKAIEAHASNGSEAIQVIGRFNTLTDTQRQDLLNFLRSL